MPMALNPAAGRLVSANHIVPAAGYPHYLGSIWAGGWRAQAIHDALDAVEAAGPAMHTVEQSVALQSDFRCIPNERLRDSFISLSQDELGSLQLAEAEAEALAALTGWDGVMSTDSVGAAVAEVAADVLSGLLLEHLLAAPPALALYHDTEELLQLYKGKGQHPTLSPRSELRSGVRGRVLTALAEPERCATRCSAPRPKQPVTQNFRCSSARARHDGDCTASELAERMQWLGSGRRCLRLAAGWPSTSGRPSPTGSGERSTRSQSTTSWCVRATPLASLPLFYFGKARTVV